MTDDNSITLFQYKKLHEAIMDIAEGVCDALQKHSIAKLMKIDNPTFEQLVDICNGIVELLEGDNGHHLADATEVMRVVTEVSRAITEQCNTTLVDCTTHLEDILERTKLKK